MSLVLDLPSELESELSAEAGQRGLPLHDYAIQLLGQGRTRRPSLRSGAELVDYWQSEGLVGTRSDILDASDHARSLREQAQQRSRP